MRFSALARALAAALLLLTPGAAGVGVYPDHSDPKPFYYLPR
jgi:hypothetical protein